MAYFMSYSKRPEVWYIVLSIGCSIMAYQAYKWYKTDSKPRSKTPSFHQDIAHINDLFHAANQKYKNGNYQAAIACYDEIIKLQPSHEQAHMSIGLSWSKLGDNDKALSHINTVIDLNKEYVAAYLLKGQLLEHTKEYKEAELAYHEAINLRPNLFEAHLFLTRLLTREGSLATYQHAISHGQKAVEFSGRKESFYALGDAYLKAGQPIKAREQYQRVLNLSPQEYNALLATGRTYEHQHMLQEAVNYYKQAIELQPQTPQGHLLLGNAYFATGNTLHAFKEHEWKWHTETFKHLDKRWDGSNPQGKRILLLVESNLDEMFLYLRFMRVLKERGATTIMRSPITLMPLLKLCDYIDELVPMGTEPTYDAVTSLASLPFLLGTTSLYHGNYLNADSQRLEYWQQQLSQYKGMKVGLYWFNREDTRLGVDQKKSISLETFAPLAQQADIKLFALHRGPINDKPFAITDFGKELDEGGLFMDTAAIIKNLDLVITIDTFIAHLAGALGVKTYLLLPYAADAKWKCKGDHTEWYPSMTLFRQPKTGDWKSVISKVIEHI